MKTLKRCFVQASFMLGMMVTALSMWGCGRVQNNAGAAQHADVSALSENSSTRPATGPSTQDTSAEALAALERLLHHSNLRWSTDTPGRFHFTVHADYGTKSVSQPMDVYVVRDHERVGILFTSKDGLPYCYMTDRLFVVVDQLNPGGLTIYLKGAPMVQWHADLEKDQMEFFLSYSGLLTRPVIALDCSSVIQAALNKLRHAALDPDSHRISVQTERSNLEVEVLTATEQEQTGLPIKSLRLLTKHTGVMMSVTDLGVGTASRFKLLNIDERSILALGLPVRPLVNQDAKAIELLIPADFGKDPRQIAAAHSLLNLLLHGPAAPDPQKGLPAIRANAASVPPIGAAERAIFSSDFWSCVQPCLSVIGSYRH